MTDRHQASKFPFGAACLAVRTEPRYWEDTVVNGVEDADGALIPLRKDELWEPIIELATGRVLLWPTGVTANVHYKVCDAGEYWLLNESGTRVATWRDSYVPDSLLCIGDKGFGDYIIMTINADGHIEGWQTPVINESEWRRLEVKPCGPEDKA